MSRRPFLLAAAVAAYLLAVAWLYRGLLMDDAYTGLHYVANLLAGHGFVFDPPRRVEGVSNAGWLLLMAPLALPLGPPAAAKALALALLGLGLAWTAAAAGSLGAGVGLLAPPALAVLLAASQADYVSFSLLGMETAALAAALAAMVWLPGRPRGLDELPRGLAGLSWLGVLAFLFHPEAVLVYPLGVAVAGLTRALPSRRAVRGLATYAAVLAAVSLLRRVYFGAWLPNTFLAKPGGPLAMARRLPELLDGSLVNVGFPFAGLFALPLLCLGYLAWRRAAPLPAAFALGACLTGYLFALYARPDWTERGRYFAPYAPAACLLLAAGLVSAGRAVAAGSRRAAAWRRWSFLGAGGLALAAAVAAFILRPGWRDLAEAARSWGWIGLAGLWLAGVAAERLLGRRSPAPGPEPWPAPGPRSAPGPRPAGIPALLVAAAIVTGGVWDTLHRASAPERLSFPGYVMTGATLAGPSLWMRDHLPAGAVVATRRIGALAYHSGHPVFDYCFGLTEPEVARLLRNRGGQPFEDPSVPALAGPWRERAPAFLLEDRAVLYTIAAQAGGTPARFRLHGLDYGEVRRFPIGTGAEWVLAARRPRSWSKALLKYIAPTLPPGGRAQAVDRSRERGPELPLEGRPGSLLQSRPPAAPGRYPTRVPSSSCSRRMKSWALVTTP